VSLEWLMSPTVTTYSNEFVNTMTHKPLQSLHTKRHSAHESHSAHEPLKEEIGIQIITTARVSNEFSRESPYISNTFSRESPNFQAHFRVFKRSHRHSKDVTVCHDMCCEMIWYDLIWLDRCFDMSDACMCGVECWSILIRKREICLVVTWNVF